jgi:hypothetical protein
MLLQSSNVSLNYENALYYIKENLAKGKIFLKYNYISEVIGGHQWLVKKRNAVLVRTP